MSRMRRRGQWRRWAGQAWRAQRELCRDLRALGTSAEGTAISSQNLPLPCKLCCPLVAPDVPVFHLPSSTSPDSESHGEMTTALQYRTAKERQTFQGSSQQSQSASSPHQLPHLWLIFPECPNTCSLSWITHRFRKTHPGHQLLLWFPLFWWVWFIRDPKQEMWIRKHFEDRLFSPTLLPVSQAFLPSSLSYLVHIARGDRMSKSNWSLES